MFTGSRLEFHLLSLRKGSLTVIIDREIMHSGQRTNKNAEIRLLISNYPVTFVHFASLSSP